MEKKFHCSFKVILVGEASVGKTCLTVKFTNDYFKENTMTTLGI